MAHAHDVMRRVLAPHPGDPLPRWEQIHGAMAEIVQDPSLESEEILRRVLERHEPLQVHPGSAHRPHAGPPLEMIHLQAVQALGRWSAERHRDHIAGVHDRTTSSLVKAVARHHLDDTGES